MVLVLDGFLDAGNAAAHAAAHLVDQGGDGTGRGDVRRRPVPRLPRPPAGDVVRPRPLRGATTPLGCWSGCCATAAARRTSCCTGPSRTTAGRRSRARCARSSSGCGSPGWSRWARCRWRCRTRGRSRSPRTPTAPSWCRAPARGAVSCGSRAARSRCSRSGWGSGATTMLGFVAHIPHYLAQLDYPQASVVLLERVELAGRLTVDLTDLRALAEEREEEIARYLVGQRGGGRGRRGARAAVRRLRAGRGGRVQPARRGPAAPDRGRDRPAVRAVPGRPRRPEGDPGKQDRERR